MIEPFKLNPITVVALDETINPSASTTPPEAHPKASVNLDFFSYKQATKMD